MKRYNTPRNKRLLNILFVVACILTILAVLTGCGESPAGTKQPASDSFQSIGYFDNANYQIIKIKTSRGWVECIRLNKMREGGLSCDWNNPTTN